jgi:hypothetical protein
MQVAAATSQRNVETSARLAQPLPRNVETSPASTPVSQPSRRETLKLPQHRAGQLVLASARPTRRDALTGVDRGGAQAEAILLTAGGLTAVALSWKRDRDWVAVAFWRKGDKNSWLQKVAPRRRCCPVRTKVQGFAGISVGRVS